MYDEAMLSGHINQGGWIVNTPHAIAGWQGNVLTVFSDITFTPDSGIYATLSGNRVYLPIMRR